MKNRWKWNAITTLGLLLLILVFYLLNILIGIIAASISLGVHFCLVVEDAFTDRLKEEEEQEQGGPHA